MSMFELFLINAKKATKKTGVKMKADEKLPTTVKPASDTNKNMIKDLENFTLIEAVEVQGIELKTIFRQIILITLLLLTVFYVVKIICR